MPASAFSSLTHLQANTVEKYKLKNKQKKKKKKRDKSINSEMKDNFYFYSANINNLKIYCQAKYFLLFCIFRNVNTFI